MGTTLTSEVLWSLGPVAPSTTSTAASTPDPGPLELAGLHHRLEGAYQTWLLHARASQQASQSAAADPTSRGLAYASFFFPLSEQTVRQLSPGFSANPDPSRYTLAKLEVDFTDGTGRLCLPVPTPPSDPTDTTSTTAVTAGAAATGSYVVNTAVRKQVLRRNGVSLQTDAPMGNVSSTTPAATAPATAAKDPQWYWQGGGKENTFAKRVNDRLEERYNAYCLAVWSNQARLSRNTASGTPVRVRSVERKKHVKMTYNGARYAIDFENMTQTNTSTNKVRKLRRDGPPPLIQQAANATPSSSTPTTADAAAAAAVPADAATSVVPANVEWFMTVRRGKLEQFNTENCATIEAFYQSCTKRYEAAVVALNGAAPVPHANKNPFATFVDPVVASCDPKDFIGRVSVPYPNNPSRRQPFQLVFCGPDKLLSASPRSSVTRVLKRGTATATTAGAATAMAQAGSSSQTGARGRSATQTSDGSPTTAAIDATAAAAAATSVGSTTTTPMVPAITTTTVVDGPASGGDALPTGEDAAARGDTTTPSVSTDAATQPTPRASAGGGQPLPISPEMAKTVAGRWQFGNAKGSRWYAMSDADTAAVEAAFMAHFDPEAVAKVAAARKVAFQIGLSSETTPADATKAKTDDVGVVKGVQCGKQTYTFDFVALTQTNEATGRVRPIRRVLDTPGQDGHYTAPSPTADATGGSGGKAQPKGTRSTARAVEREVEFRGGSAPRGDRSTYLGKGEVDKFCPKRGVCEVYADGTGLYQCMLNKSDIRANNNKFYFMQVLYTPKKAKEFFVYCRWGRVGASGQTTLIPFDSADAAVARFKEIFYDKTGRNPWDKRHEFSIRRGNYILMRIDNRTDEEREAEDGPSTDATASNGKSGAAANGAKPAILEPPSKLHPLVKELMEYITDRSDMSAVMAKDFSLDVKRMPLGRVTKEQIRDAYRVLTAIEDELKKDVPRTKELDALSNIFYTLLPHIVSVHSSLPCIDNLTLLQKKIDLVQNLGDMEIANEIMKASTANAGKSNEVTENRLDRIYNHLGAQLTPLDDSNEMVERIKRNVAATTGATHYMIPHVQTVFEVHRRSDEARFNALREAHKGTASDPFTNVRMLWHGSRKTNFMGILSQGLRIAPPEAPCTGYMFGKGIYFADVVSKASNYCNPQKNRGLMLLSEVALGHMHELGSSKFMLKPQPGSQSTLGVGEYAPNVAGNEMVNNVLWAMGKVEKRTKFGKYVKKTSLIYPEYIIYDPAQYRMRYLISMTFKRR